MAMTLAKPLQKYTDEIGNSMDQAYYMFKNGRVWLVSINRDGDDNFTVNPLATFPYDSISEEGLNLDVNPSATDTERSALIAYEEDMKSWLQSLELIKGGAGSLASLFSEMDVLPEAKLPKGVIHNARGGLTPVGVLAEEGTGR